ncbi:MAG TPA: MBL fold metallo-hydrolase [Tepidisphaeraceae bacterium]|nr:MBL fold metallo-hydrolase [Tepidisphaeraceae bacterium]
MQILQHVRTQHPIGQGFFHSGEVLVGRAAFRYVVDCGSTQPKVVRREVTDYLELMPDGKRLSALFLSHIDNDHVSGLDELLVNVSTTDAFLPLLTPAARLALAAHAIEQGRLSGTHLDFLADPGRWLGERGVGRIFFVRGGPPEGDGVVPPTPTPNQESDVTSIEIDDRRLIEPPTSNDEPGSRQARLRGARRRSFHHNTFEISHLRPIPLRTRGGALLDWVFIAFVHPDESALQRFDRAVRREFSAIPQTAVQFRSWVFELVRSRANRRRLRGCYHVARIDVNAMSMSLYSGPSGTVLYDVRFALRRVDSEYRRSKDQRVGWLGTGDADLRRDLYRGEFEGHFARVLGNVGTFTLPHHGSIHNFHPTLLELGPQYYVVSSRTGNRHHPHRDVRRALRWRQFLHVTEGLETRVDETVELRR